jgi:hypothetical protein
LPDGRLHVGSFKFLKIGVLSQRPRLRQSARLNRGDTARRQSGADPVHDIGPRPHGGQAILGSSGARCGTGQDQLRHFQALLPGNGEIHSSRVAHLVPRRQGVAPVRDVVELKSPVLIADLDPAGGTDDHEPPHVQVNVTCQFEYARMVRRELLELARPHGLIEGKAGRDNVDVVRLVV